MKRHLTTIGPLPPENVPFPREFHILHNGLRMLTHHRIACESVHLPDILRVSSGGAFVRDVKQRRSGMVMKVMKVMEVM